VKDANRSAHIDGGDDQQREARKPPQPGSAKQRENQRGLDAGSDHLTDAMRRSKRGTFP
jgi:hypothetical protein